MRGSYEEKKDGCFLTKLAHYKGFSDNCYELQQLRIFRDSYVVNLPNSKNILKKYYSEAPVIVKFNRKGIIIIKYL